MHQAGVRVDLREEILCRGIEVDLVRRDQGAQRERADGDAKLDGRDVPGRVIDQIERVPRDERVFGPGSSPIMAAFTHVNLLGSRFSDGRFGVFYAARERATAVAETKHHHGNFMAATRQPATHLPMRLYHVAIDARGGTWLRADDGTLVRVEDGLARVYPHGRASALLESTNADGQARASDVWVALDASYFDDPGAEASNLIVQMQEM